MSDKSLVHVVLTADDNVNWVLKKFKRKCESYGIIKEYRKRKAHKKPSIKAKEKREGAEKRRVKEMKKRHVTSKL